jgi:hypothetical protein
MFIRAKKVSPESTAVQIIEAYRKDGIPKQHVLRHVGTGRNEEEVARLKELATAIKTQLIQQTLIRNRNQCLW